MLWKRLFWFTLLFIVTFNIFTCLTEDVKCKEIANKSVDSILKNYLFCNYDMTIRPTLDHKNVTEIAFAVIPKVIELNDMINIFTLQAWTLFSWTDVHLTWDLNKFNRSRVLHITADEIWIPDIIVHNSGDSTEDRNEISFTQCSVQHTGTVMCLGSSIYSVLCDTDYTMWPYDTQNCSIKLASWSHSDSEIAFRMIQTGVLLDNYMPSWIWKLIGTGTFQYQKKFKFQHEESSSIINIHFVLERQANVKNFIYITPIFIMKVLTLTTLWLDINSLERMTLALINVICHLLAIGHILWELPFNGSSPPKLLIFHEYSLAMAAFTLILSMLLREVQEFNFAPPKIVTLATSQVLKSRIGQILLLSILDPEVSACLEDEADDNLNLVNSKSKNRVWGHVTILIGWIAFISVFIAYLIMLIVLMPAPIH